jgi:AcrR family transcriptional regulator
MSNQLRVSRRSQAEVKAAILSAATALFAERGYANATTRAIAQAADASEVLIFRYFHSKAELFEQAISAPFDALMDEAWRLMGHGERVDGVEYSRTFVPRLFDTLDQDRRLILALITTRAYEAAPDEGDDKPRGLRRYFQRAEESIARFYEEEGIQTGVKPAFAARLAFSSVVSAVLLNDWLFDDAGDREQVVESVTEFVTKALYGPPLGAAAPASRYRRRKRLRVAGATYRRRR